MASATLSVFISYSRTDSAFVDRLEADLRARNFYIWVDRRKLEGGQDWMDELQKAIDRCQVMVVVLSPEAMESRYVLREYRYADQQGKPFIPLNLRSTKVPMDLNGLQWVDFQSSYDQSLYDLQIALSRQELAAPPPTRIYPTTSLAISEPELVLVTPEPAPPPPDVDLAQLYRAGVVAKSEGNLERTAILWQQVLDRDPDFGNGTVKPQMDRLLPDLHLIRVQRLRKQAEEAYQAGEWGKEIGAWEALLGLETYDDQASVCIPIAQHNQKYLWMYEHAQELSKENRFEAVETQLGLIWEDAPNYGDPAGLTTQTNLKVPEVEAEEFALPIPRPEEVPVDEEDEDEDEDEIEL